MALDFSSRSVGYKPPPRGAGAAARADGPDFSDRANAKPSDTYAREKAKALEERRDFQKREEDKRQSQREAARTWMPQFAQDALKSKDSFVRNVGDSLNAFTYNAPLPILDELNAGARAGGNEVANLFRRPEDRVSSKDIYLAQMDADREIAEGIRKEHPVSSFLGSIAGGLGKAGAARAPGLLAGVGEAVEGLKSPVARWAGRGALAAGRGGVEGAAYGAADAAPGERLEGAKTGAAVGATTAGLLDTVAIPAATKAVRTFAPVASKLRRKITGKSEATATELKQARAAVAEMASQGGLKSAADVHQRATGMGPDEFADQGAIGAELIGKQGEGQLQSIARRPGQTGDIASAAMLARSQAAPRKIEEAFQEDLGIDPTAARGNLERTVQEDSAAARPEWEAALGPEDATSMPGVWTPELGQLANVDLVQEAMRSAEKSGLRRGTATEGLAYGDVDVPQGAGPEFYDPDGLALRSKGQGAVTGGTQMLKAIGDLGGLRTRDAADLLGADADKWHIGRPYMRRLFNPNPEKALDLERMAEALYDRGFFPGREGKGPPDPNEFMGIIRDQLRGQTTYAKGGQAVERRPGQKAVNAEQDYYGTPAHELPTPDQYGADVHTPPEREPALMEAPTARAWDAARRRLNELVNWRAKPGEETVLMRDQREVALRLTRVLAGDDGLTPAIPGLRAALDKSGDAIRLREAFNDFGERLFQDKKDFAAAWAKLRPDAKAGAMAAMANDVDKLFGRGLLKGGKFAAPNVRTNLELAFGKKGADAFVRKMEVHSKLAASGNRFNPDSGSGTFKHGAQAQETDSLGATVFDAAKAAASMKTGNMAGMMDAASKVWGWAKTHEQPVTVRDEMGRILLMDADDFAKFVQEFADDARAAVAGRAVKSQGRTSAAVRATVPYARDDEQP